MKTVKGRITQKKPVISNSYFCLINYKQPPVIVHLLDFHVGIFHPKINNL